jgi:hypothetical protein
MDITKTNESIDDSSSEDLMPVLLPINENCSDEEDHLGKEANQFLLNGIYFNHLFKVRQEASLISHIMTNIQM